MLVVPSNPHRHHHVPVLESVIVAEAVPVVAETTESSAAVSVDVSVSAATPDESVVGQTEEARKRPVFNPSTEDFQTRAVGSIGAEVETEATAIAAAAAAQSEAAISSSGPVGQIELPPKEMSLDDGLEKEIEAASFYEEAAGNETREETRKMFLDFAKEEHQQGIE